MRKRLRLTMLALCLSCLATSADAARDDQWVFRGELGDGSTSPTALFLSWDYSQVLFRATCDRSSNELILRYYGDGEVTLTALSPPLIILGGKAVELRTRLLDGILEGRVTVEPSVLVVLDGPNDLQIVAPNAMEEAWHVGIAKPLRELIALCREARL